MKTKNEIEMLKHSRSVKNNGQKYVGKDAGGKYNKFVREFTVLPFQQWYIEKGKVRGTGPCAST